MSDKPILIEGESSAEQSQRLQLPPCPFCAGPPTLYCEEDSVLIDDVPHVFVSAHVFCHECGAKGETTEHAWPDEHDLFGASREDAARFVVDRWSKRDKRHGHMYPYSGAAS